MDSSEGATILTETETVRNFELDTTRVPNQPAAIVVSSTTSASIFTIHSTQRDGTPLRRALSAVSADSRHMSRMRPLA